MNTYEKQVDKYKQETCPKCGKDATLKAVGTYGTGNMKYKCNRCKQLVLDQETRGRLKLRASWR